jgi:hypothetical protein
MWEITPAKSASISNRIGTASWTKNAQPFLVTYGVSSALSRRFADYSSKWKVTHWKSVNTRRRTVASRGLDYVLNGDLSTPIQRSAGRTNFGLAAHRAKSAIE